MKAKTLLVAMIGVLPLAAAVAAPASAAPRPAAGCKSDPKTMELNKKVVIEFFRPGITVEERIGLMGPDYTQHNPVYLKRAQTDHISTIEAFRRIQNEGRARAAAAPPATGPKPPAGDPAFIAVAECDFVVLIRKTYRQDPTAAPGTFYEAYPYDSYTLKNGKLFEHWDGATIDPPPPSAR
jgi:predicted SnoaL-like aldol condensation-catalyzing enzyme